MSRSIFIFGLIVSAALHAAALWWPHEQADDVEKQVAETPRVQVLPMPMPVAERQDRVPERKPEPAARPDPPRERERAEPQRRESVQQPLPPRRTSPTLAEPADRGDFAGTSDAQPRPALRIDWGSPKEARQVLQDGGMRLVVIDAPSSGVMIVSQLEWVETRWQVRPYVPAVGPAYSNRLRIVDDVPAFAAAVRAARLGSGQRLAVLVPDKIEHMLDAAQLAAAYRHGVGLAEVRNFGGSFEQAGRGLAFRITRIQTRSGQP